MGCLKDGKVNNFLAQPAAMTALLAEKRNKGNWAIVDWDPTFVNGWEDLQVKKYFLQDGSVACAHCGGLRVLPS
jgi:ABC-type proline/glycine betaine transport system substrate-binding protein